MGVGFRGLQPGLWTAGTTRAGDLALPATYGCKVARQPGADFAGTGELRRQPLAAQGPEGHEDRVIHEIDEWRVRQHGLSMLRCTKTLGFGGIMTAVSDEDLLNLLSVAGSTLDSSLLEDDHALSDAMIAMTEWWSNQVNKDQLPHFISLLSYLRQHPGLIDLILSKMSCMNHSQRVIDLLTEKLNFLKLQQFRED